MPAPLLAVDGLFADNNFGDLLFPDRSRLKYDFAPRVDAATALTNWAPDGTPGTLQGTGTVVYNDWYARYGGNGAANVGLNTHVVVEGDSTQIFLFQKPSGTTAIVSRDYNLETPTPLLVDYGPIITTSSVAWAGSGSVGARVNKTLPGDLGASNFLLGFAWNRDAKYTIASATSPGGQAGYGALRFANHLGLGDPVTDDTFNRSRSPTAELIFGNSIFGTGTINIARVSGFEGILYEEEQEEIRQRFYKFYTGKIGLYTGTSI